MSDSKRITGDTKVRSAIAKAGKAQRVRREDAARTSSAQELPSIEQLKRDAKLAIAGEHEARLDRNARADRDGPILATFDRMQNAVETGEAYENPNDQGPLRHPPRLTLVSEDRDDG